MPKNFMRTFIAVWFGQTASVIGSGLTAFALGVWVFLETGSATRFALIGVMASVPGLLFSPIAGALVDRWNRRTAMMISDSGAAAATVGLAFLVGFDRLEVWHIYVYVAVNSFFNCFQFPAFSAAISLVVPKEHLGRAAGMVTLARAISHTAAPAMAGVLLERFGLLKVIFADLSTFLIAIVTLLVVTIPRPKKTEVGEAGRGSLLREAWSGWTYIRQRPGLLSLLLYFAGFNLLVPMAFLLATPLVLSFTDSAELGFVLSIGALGTLCSSLLMIVWGGPKVKIHGILGSAPVAITGMVLAGLQPSAPMIAAGLFLAFATMPIIGGCSQAIWQRKVEHDVQGRVFSVRSLVAQSTAPVAFLIAGPLADRVFEPLLLEGGPLVDAFGPWLGVGPGRGIGLLYLVLAALFIVWSLMAWNYRPLRDVEVDLPDADEHELASPGEEPDELQSSR